MRNKFLAFGVPDYTYREIRAVKKAMRSKWIGMGPLTLDFETKIAEFVGSENCLTVSSCTDALFLALKVSNVGPGDEVIVPSLTWCSTVNSIIYAGATPVFCDVDRDTFNINFKQILDKITSKTKAIIVVHFGGLAVEVGDLRSAIPKEIEIIEDAAHAFGSKFKNGDYVGSSGNLTCFSFYANKNLATGEGGAITFQDSEYKERIEKLRMNGLSNGAWSRYVSKINSFVNPIESLGYKMNYTDLQASIGIVQLRRLGIMSRQRSKIIKYYIKKFSNSTINLTFQKSISSPNHSKHLFLVIFEKVDSIEKRNKFVVEMRSRNIGVSIHYTPLHLQPFYKHMSTGGNLDNTEYLGSCAVTLPISATMKKKDVRKVLKNVKIVLKLI